MRRQAFNRGAHVTLAVALFLLPGSTAPAAAQDGEEIRLEDGWYTLTTGAGARVLTVYYFDEGNGVTTLLMAGAVSRSDKTPGYRETGTRWYYDGRYLRLEGDRSINLCQDDNAAAAMVIDEPRCHWSITSTDGGETWVIRSDINGRVVVGRYLDLNVEETDNPSRAQRWEIR
jgi:hypothetical protein